MVRKQHRHTGKAVARVYIGALLFLVIGLGLVCRLAPIGLPSSWSKWGGSVLWGAMFWCFAALIIGKGSSTRLFLAACLGAAASESLKLMHFPLLDALRASSAGHFILGHQFAWTNLAAYGIGISCMTLLARPSNAAGTRRHN
ncbi:hypothetical protein QE368_001124 [Asaia bogorensis NBRC 16594]|nr:hypothetical protein [Asaia bogorensis NBRC 16594]